MDGGIATVVSAVVAAVGAVTVGLLQRFRNENRKDHAEVISELRWLRRIVERVETKHDAHVEQFHSEEGRGKSRSSRKVAAQTKVSEHGDVS